MENIQGFLVLNSYALLLIIITSIIFFKKKRQKQIEDQTYAILLIVTILVSVSGLALGILVNPNLNINEVVIKIFNKVYLLCLLLWITILTFYTLCISVIKSQNIEKLKKIFLCLTLFNATVILLLPITVEINEQVTISSGSAILYTYVMFALGFICQIICVILDIKNIKNKKYIPIYTLAFFGIIVLIIQMLFPNLNYLISPAIIVITYIMFHTIENPDVKVITQLNLAKEHAERSNRAKSDFLSSMSHEIRTPLNAIVGLSDNLTSYESDIPPEMIDDINDIKSASMTLLEIVGNILDINKIESENFDLNEVEYNFKEEITKLAKIASTKIDGKPINFKINIAEDVPTYLIGDKTYVKEIISNLLTNAFKYTERGIVDLNVKCIIKGKNCLLIISVQDTGRGIKKENIDKLFNKFHRLEDDVNTTIEGTGLGLAITKSLVDMMGGKINVQSQYGIGSLFIVQIPQKIVEDSKENNGGENKSQENLSLLNCAIKSKKKILIVDDSKLNQKVAARFIIQLGHEVETCDSGIECINKLENDMNYDLILMDIMMPDLSGEETLTKLQQIPKFDIPVIALTADAVVGAREKYLQLGFVEYLSKPFTKEQLAEKINFVLK